MLLKITHRLSALFLLIFIMNASVSAQSISILRDAETEAFLRKIGNPIFEAARLTPENVELHLVGSSSINAFVTGGQNIFFHSGLLLAMNDVDELHGVMAHETGHIAGGHGVRFKDSIQEAGNFSIASMVLGALAMAAGSPDAGMAIMMAGQQMTYGSILSYSRTQESSTDQAGAVFLQRAGISGKGLISFFRTLRGQEVLYARSQNPYMRTHPLTSDRIQKLEQVVAQSPYNDKAPDPELDDEFKRIQAKLEGYIKGANFTLNKYPLSDQSVYAKYARVYAYHKALEWDKAIAEVDDLIDIEPGNPYFYEIKGQVMFESGKHEAALAPFKKAVDLSGNSPLIMTAYAQALLSIEDGKNPYTQAYLDQALPILREATRLDPDNTFGWFNLAKVYSYMDKPDYAALATAERFFSSGNMPRALFQAKQAQRQFSRGTREWLRAEDISIIAEQAVRRMQARDGRRFSISSTNTQ